MTGKKKKGEGEGVKEAFVPVKDEDQREAIRWCCIFKYLTKGQTLESCKGNFKMKCRFCDKPPFQGSQARGAEHFTKGRCPKVTPEVLVDIWNTTQYPFDQRRERQVRDYMEYRGIRNNREVGVGVLEDDEVQDVLDREGADNEGGQCGGEDDEMDTGAEGEGEGQTKDTGEDDVQELGASLRGGSLKARRTAHQTRTRAPMDGRGKRRADTAPAACVPDPKRFKQVRQDEMYDPEWQTTFDHLFLQWWYIGGVPFERARMLEYRALTRHLQNMPRGMKPTLPQFKRIAGSGIQEERAYRADKLRDIREQMQHTGATIITDGRKSLNSEPIVNFLAAGQSGAFLFTTVRREGVDAETTNVVLQCWKKVFEKFSVKNINAICTDSAVYVAVGRALCNDTDPDIRRIPWLPCSVHCYNLMLSDMVKDKTWAIDLLTRARAVVRFIDVTDRLSRCSGVTARGPIAMHGRTVWVAAPRAEHLRRCCWRGIGRDFHGRGGCSGRPGGCAHSDQQKKVAEMTLEYIYTQTGFDRQGDRYRLVRQQLYDFHARGPRYDWGGDAGTGDEDTCEGPDETQAIADWWVLHGSCALELCAIATRLMYTWVCASPAERNWALHERIHEKRRNGLDFTKLTEMVEMCANKKLLACRQRRRGLVLPWGDVEEGLDDVPEPRRSGILPPGSLTDEEIARQARRMQCASTVRHPLAVQTVFGRRAAHIELYNEEIEYDPPTDPHAANEMEAEPWTNPEDLEQRGSDTPDVGDEPDEESDHEAAGDMRSRDRQSHCDVDRMTPPLTRSATDRWRKQTQVVRSSTEDEGGDRSDDGDAADDEDSDVEREGPDQDRGHGDEHGFDGGDDSGPIEDGAGGAFLVTPGPSAVGGGGSGGHGFGLEVPQGSIPSGIFSDGFDLGRPPTSDARRDGVRVQTPVSEVAHLIGSVFCGASSGLLTEAARAPGEIQEGRTGDDVRRVARRLHMDPEDVLEEERLARMVSGCATTQQLALEQDTTRAREMGCSVEEVTAARLAAECRHDGPADVADGGGLCTEGYVVDRADDHQEDARVGLRGLRGASDTLLPSTDEADGGDGAATTDAGRLLGCDRTEVEGQVDRALVGVVVAAMVDVVADHTQDGLVAVDAMDAHRSEEERQVDPGDVVAHPVEAHVPSMSPLERQTAGIDPVMGRNMHISKRLWKAMPPSSFVPVSQRVIKPGGVSWGAGPVAAGTRPACAGAVSGRGGESGGSVVGGGGGPEVVGGRSGLSGGSVGWGEGSAAPATAGGRGQVQGSPSPSSKVKGKSVSWSGISRVTRKLKDVMPGVTGERRDREGRLTEMFADAAGWVRKGDRLEHPGAGSSCAADRRGSTMVAPPSRPPTAGAAQRDGHRRPKGRSSTHALPGVRPPPASLEDDPDPVTLQTSRGGCISTVHRILNEEPRRQTGTGPSSRRAAGGRTEDSATDGVPIPRGRKTYTTLTDVLGRSAGAGVEREAEVQEAKRVAARAVGSHVVSASQHPGEGEETAAKVPQRRRERIIDDDDTNDGQCDAP
ncbi:hypothetical protein CBR_g41728 [Chara braunii]|uniref:DUF659 domain-containing protein n=1 Tax=Chara braunii TaxID=69332 RepID=A0A388LWI9_CHABU|nr:hypothetical protein CBR_g41728 [Chara braunii]|eukprot:GBG86666.1 hypothetical protein CBR_g41728 [Chara braunii]